MRRIVRRLDDSFRYARISREILGWRWLAAAMLTRDPVSRAERIAKALGFAGAEPQLSICLKQIHSNPSIDKAGDIWAKVMGRVPRYREYMAIQSFLDRSIILKAPIAGGEKGVLLMTFEYNWARLLLGLSHEEFCWIDQHYDLIFSTSSSPTSFAGLMLAISRVSGTVFVQACNPGDISLIERIHPRLKCLPTMPCDWIHSGLHQPKPHTERTFDFIMVAMWAPVKRHWEFLEALLLMPPNLQVVLIGTHDGHHTHQHIRKMADEIGVKQELVILDSIPIEEVARYQSDSKVSVIMSRREGCCVAAVESLFAGCALALRDDAHVGPLAYINEQTGRRLRPNHIAQDLLTLLADSANTHSREWALEHVSGSASWAKVNKMLGVESVKHGRPWTRDIIEPQWRPHPTFLRTSDREEMRPAYEELQRRMPKLFDPSLITDSWQ
jgi:glycosyltransferase involved in cell wall biosynthesis